MNNAGDYYMLFLPFFMGMVFAAIMLECHYYKRGRKLKAKEEEIKRCKESPYYFMTKYGTINGKPYTTHLTEKEFNQIIKNYMKK